MIIHSVTEPNKSFVWSSTGMAFNALGATVFDYEAWVETLRNGIHSPLYDVDLVIFESVYLEWTGLTVKQLRAIYPKAKVVCLGSDTIYYVVTGKNGGYQIQHPQDCDLFLEQMSECIDFYEAKGVNVDRWMWTASEWLLNFAAQFKDLEKENDFIGVYAPHTISEPGYRQDMVNYIKNAGRSFSRGDGIGHEDNELDSLLSWYGRSRYTLETSSHNNPQLKNCVKGFRTFLGAETNTLLMCDDNPDIIRYYDDPQGRMIPIYKYGNFQEIIDLADYYDSHPAERNLLITRQRDWVRQNTIEKQLKRLLTKHKII